MGAFLLWYLLITVLGLAVFPLAFRLLPALPDRGYAASRTLGLLLWGYLFWLLASLGAIHNDLGGLVLALFAVLLLSGYALYRTNRGELRLWWRLNRRVVVGVELVFLVAFAMLALVRAADPSIVNTEKPMEMAFINSIVRSPVFPPHDPWLSGYAISYYYFGYVLVAMLAKLAGTPGPVAFNLGIALVFALAAAGVYGLVVNLLAAHLRRSRAALPVEPPPVEIEAGPPPGASLDPGAIPGGVLWIGLLGPLFVQVFGNLEGLLEILHRRGLFWDLEGPDGPVSRFWSWLGILDLNQPPALPLAWTPRQYGFGWWWWRASRVISDYTFTGEWKEIIDEFPAFSYLLADLHPHVLAVPFAFLAVALALNLYLGGAKGNLPWSGGSLSGPAFLLAGVVLGGMGFLNLWDFPIYVALFAGALALRRAYRLGWNVERVKEFMGFSLALLAAGVVLYLPFYLGFSSQAGGLLPSLVYFTRGAHLWVMFGTLFLPLGAYLAYLWSRQGTLSGLLRGAAVAAALLAGLGMLTAMLVLTIQNLDRLQGLNPLAGMAESAFLGSMQAPLNASGEYLWRPVLIESLERRLEAPGAWLTLTALLVLVLGLLLGHRDKQADDRDLQPEVEAGSVIEVALPEPPRPMFPSLHLFVLLMVLLGALLVFTPEFFYLRDQFGSRMNTIFKFYFQAWLLWGAGAAFGVGFLLFELPRLWRVLFRFLLLGVAAAGLIYPAFWGWEKLQGLDPAGGWSLDGAKYIERGAPAEAGAIAWLRSAPPGVIVEAVGGQYSDFARVSVYSGQPAVLGWPGHESQWRGGAREMGTRQEDIQRLYTTPSWDEAADILMRYKIRYLVIGPRERQTYRISEAKFRRSLIPAFEQGDYIIYQVPFYDETAQLPDA